MAVINGMKPKESIKVCVVSMEVENGRGDSNSNFKYPRNNSGKEKNPWKMLTSVCFA